jgi:cytoskeleton protein RodZ
MADPEMIAGTRADLSSCGVCGARLDGGHVEPRLGGYVCAFCGSERSHDLLGDLSPDGSAPIRVEPPAEVGEALRAAREERGIPLARAARATRIHERFLRALEEGESLEPFPGHVYARFFLRDYSEYLGLDAEPLLRPFDAAGSAEPLRPVQVPVMKPPGRRGWRVSAMLTVVALVAIGVASNLGASTDPATPTEASMPAFGAQTSTGSVTSDTGARPPAVPGILAVLRFSERCWVEATADGRPRVAETFEAGATLRLRADRAMELAFGNAPGVILTVSGRRVPTAELPAVVTLTFEWRHGEVIPAQG